MRAILRKGRLQHWVRLMRAPCRRRGRRSNRAPHPDLCGWARCRQGMGCDGSNWPWSGRGAVVRHVVESDLAPAAGAWRDRHQGSHSASCATLVGERSWENRVGSTAAGAVGSAGGPGSRNIIGGGPEQRAIAGAVPKRRRNAARVIRAMTRRSDTRRPELAQSA